ncbi:hypothetical protein Poly24_32770 [Rosistilla carotiformis]|uniref:Uncharacterized protein n=1 Tax=Rosistilla carotiformis TaxID=2528017 RepID=A0A518JVI6_9BACT|nr:transmembrane prediction [Rosistilla carotiformis]QDV69561.1 hypothetical protein Poly24_32770 [Rosistilla carotiformis]
MTDATNTTTPAESDDMQTTTPAVSYRALRNHIVWLLIPPTTWAIHFLASYLTIAIVCAKSETGDAMPIRIAIAIYTLVALGVIALVGWHSHRQHRHGDASAPHDGNTSDVQLRFIGYATLLLAALSGVATLFTALVVLFIGSCD